MRQVAAEIGVWDVFILNAGYLPSPSSIASADVADYWKSYEVRFSTASLPRHYKTIPELTILLDERQTCSYSGHGLPTKC